MEKDREKNLEESIRVWNESIPDVSEEEIDAAWWIMRQEIRPPFRWMSLIGATVVAVAVLLLGVFIGSRFSQGLRTDTSSKVHWMEAYAEQGCHQSIVLPDQTRVKLKSGTRLLYPDRFVGGERDVFLSGEAFFDVEKDPSHPFQIHSDNIKVIVTGTTLNVRSYASDPCITTSLLEGSVAFDIPGIARQNLNPGGVLEFNKGNRSVKMHTMSPDEYPVWYEDHYDAFNKTLGQIAEDLAERYNLTIDVTDKKLASTIFYVSFVNGESVWDILSALNIDGTFQVVRNGNRVTISPEKKQG